MPGHNASVTIEDASLVGGRAKSLCRDAAGLKADCPHRILRDEIAEGLSVGLRINGGGQQFNAQFDRAKILQVKNWDSEKPKSGD
jgi:hypothetical protein